MYYLGKTDGTSWGFYGSDINSVTSFRSDGTVISSSTGLAYDYYMNKVNNTLGLNLQSSARTFYPVSELDIPVDMDSFVLCE